jgi:uncharacterized protein (DUF952 family)
MILIAQPLLESRISAYIEWLANEVIMTANNLYLKDELLVMLCAKQNKLQTKLPIISLRVGKLFPLVG